MEYESNNDGDESDGNGDESDDDSNEDRFVGMHLINNAADMLVVDGSWEPTEDDDLESLVSEEDLVCCHLTMDPIEESDDKDLSKSDKTTCEPIVEIVEEEVNSKFVYDDTEELFLTTEVHVKDQTMNDTQLDVDNIQLVYDEHHEHSKQTFHQEVSDADLVTEPNISRILGPDFLQGKD